MNEIHVKRFFIYKISNDIDEKLYVGISRDVKGRWRAHKSEAFLAQTSIYFDPFYDAIREYGVDKFHVETIDEGTNREAMYTREQYWIQKLNTKWPNGYNMRGKLIDEETCRQIENDLDRGNYSVYTLANSLTGEIFAIKVEMNTDSIRYDLQRAKSNWTGQTLLTKIIRSIWQSGGKVVIRRMPQRFDTYYEADKLRDKLLIKLDLKLRGSIVVSIAEVPA